MPARGTRFATLAAALTLGATLTLSGCGDDDDGGGGLSEVGEQIDQKTDEGADKISDGADKVSDAGKDGAEKAGDKAEDAGDKVKDETNQ